MVSGNQVQEILRKKFSVKGKPSYSPPEGYEVVRFVDRRGRTKRWMAIPPENTYFGKNEKKVVDENGVVEIHKGGDFLVWSAGGLWWSILSPKIWADGAWYRG